jgi:asparagine synthetase B (glutamine-hydrolysing)
MKEWKLLIILYYFPSQFFNKYRNKYLNEQYNYYKSIKNIQPFKREIIKTIEKDILPQLLHYADRNAMDFTIEGRYPFLDHNLVEGMMRIPGIIHRNNNISKYLLRKHMNNKLPDLIVNNYNKNGFFVPQREWINILKNLILHEIESNNFLNIYFNNKFLEKVCIMLRQNDINKISYKYAYYIWLIYNFVKWKDIYL